LYPGQENKDISIVRFEESNVNDDGLLLLILVGGKPKGAIKVNVIFR
jgi:hypothetical protein